MEQQKESEFLRLQSAVRRECETCAASKGAVDLQQAIRTCVVALCYLRPVRPYQRVG